MGVLDSLSQAATSLLFSTAVSFVVGALVLYAALLSFQVSPLRRLPYPPGPPPTGLISGNASTVPTTKPWITYNEWAKEHGPVLHYRIYNRHIIILSSIDDCLELFEKRSNIYSDRPRVPMIELMGWDFAAGMMPYGPRWRAQRRLLQQAFKRDATYTYRPNQTRKVNDFLYGLLTSPNEFRDHVKTVTAAIIMSTVYDYDISPKGDYFVTLAEDAIAGLSRSFLPGAQAVNAFPILRFLPSWFPGAGFHNYAAETRELTRQMQEAPLKYVEDRMAAGTTTSCLVADQLKKCKSLKDYIALKEFASVSYAGGAETITSSLETFFHAMAISPEVQKKAQHQLDMVVGTSRLPTHDDRSSLPYIEAVYREVLRWRPVLPLGVAHAVVEDDVYKGYFIPKGTVILPNAWAIAHNPDRYKSPELFNPDRFFDANGSLNNDNVEYTFGFGRRICPGRHIASASLWLAIATVLSTFNIGKGKDALGEEIPITGEYTDGLIMHPLPHACSIVPRHKEANQIIMEATSSKSG